MDVPDANRLRELEAGEVKPSRARLEVIAAVRKMGRREALARLAQAA